MFFNYDNVKKTEFIILLRGDKKFESVIMKKYQTQNLYFMSIYM